MPVEVFVENSPSERRRRGDGDDEDEGGVALAQYGGKRRSQLSSVSRKISVFPCAMRSQNEEKVEKFWWRKRHWVLLLITFLSFFCLFLSILISSFGSMPRYSVVSPTERTSLSHFSHWLSSRPLKYSHPFSVSPYIHASLSMEKGIPYASHSFHWERREVGKEGHSLLDLSKAAMVPWIPAVRGGGSVWAHFFGGDHTWQRRSRGEMKKEDQEEEEGGGVGKQAEEKVGMWKQATSGKYRPVERRSSPTSRHSFFSLPGSIHSLFPSFSSWTSFSSLTSWRKGAACSSPLHPPPPMRTSTTTNGGGGSSPSTNHPNHNSSLPTHRRKNNLTPASLKGGGGAAGSPLSTPPSPFISSGHPTSTHPPLPPLPPPLSGTTLREVCRREITLYCHPHENMLRCLLDIFSEQRERIGRGKKRSFPSESSSSMWFSPSSSLTTTTTAPTPAPTAARTSPTGTEEVILSYSLPSSPPLRKSALEEKGGNRKGDDRHGGDGVAGMSLIKGSADFSSHGTSSSSPFNALSTWNVERGEKVEAESMREMNQNVSVTDSSGMEHNEERGKPKICQDEGVEEEEGMEEEGKELDEDDHDSVLSPHCEDWLLARESCIEALQEHMRYRGAPLPLPPNFSGEMLSVLNQGQRGRDTGFSCSLSEPARDCLRRAPLRLLPQSCRDSTYYRAVIQGGMLKSR